VELRVTAFWDRVDQRGADECWPWQAGLTASGYGSLNKRTWGESVAHRLAWRLANESAIPDGMFICHHCDNPPCCNPAHLFLGTAQDNMRDRNAKGRAAPKVGRLNGRAILTEDQVREIRRVYRRGHKSRQGDPRSIPMLARKYGVSESAVRLVVNGQHWRHLEHVDA
jgi:hypothetical protein